ncbi:hypothetical protein [Thauera sp. Sel9]|uniref:hypothetical protein n=1 Tax=Thauera sp. Sel9 TaxID=2974299 RepID=UPI0021E133B4|nr:hypothetical protein [Thauera sp. Sel9]MCV2216775.1 hypothetical protein [Thauera sp. Sel9]
MPARSALALTAAAAAVFVLAGCTSAPRTSAPEQASAPSSDLERARAWVGDQGAPVAAIAGGLLMLSDLKMLKVEYLAGALVAFAIYDPLAPTWRIDVRESGAGRVRMALRMKSLITGGDGEARQVFLRNAREMVEAGGFAGYEIVHYEEGVESTRPFAHRYANAEIRLLRSQIFPAL